MYHTAIIGIKQSDLDAGIPFDLPKPCIDYIFDNWEVIGQNLRGDCRAIDIDFNHYRSTVEDLQDSFTDFNGQA